MDYLHKHVKLWLSKTFTGVWLTKLAHTMFQAPPHILKTEPVLMIRVIMVMLVFATQIISLIPMLSPLMRVKE